MLLNVVAAVGRPTSTTELSRIVGETLGATAHHVRRLAADGYLEWAGERRVRGALQTFYVISDAGKQAQRAGSAALLAELLGVVHNDEGDLVVPEITGDDAESAVEKLRDLFRRAA